MTLYCSPRGRTGKGRGAEGSGLYPELAAYRISEGCSPNVQSEVGRLVGLLPIEQARAELARRAWNSTRKRSGESLVSWGHRCWRPAPATSCGSVVGNSRRQRVRGQERRGRDRRRPGPRANRGGDDSRQRQAETEEVPGRVARAQGCHPVRGGQEGADGSGKPPRHRRYAPRARCVDRIGGVSSAPNGCRPGRW